MSDFAKDKNVPANDCISRQSAINAIENTECELLPCEWDELTNAIMQLPSSEPKKGKWIDEGVDSGWHPHHAYRCSVCGEQIIEASYQIHEYKYCFNCGAKMEVAE